MNPSDGSFHGITAADLDAEHVARATSSGGESAASLTAHRRRWSSHDEDRLRMSWGIHPVAEIAKDLGRDPLAICKRAAILGLGRGCPQGFESIAASARRTGFEFATLMCVIRWAHVTVRPSASPPSSRNARFIVEPADVDRAVERWCASESLHAASVRTGYAASKLRTALLRAEARGDVQLPGNRSAKGRWRVAPEIVDAVIATRWGAKEDLQRAAARVGVSPEALRKWLWADGHRPLAGERTWSLNPEVVDAVIARKRAEGNRAFRKTRNSEGVTTT